MSFIWKYSKKTRWDVLISELILYILIANLLPTKLVCTVLIPKILKVWNIEYVLIVYTWVNLAVTKW